MPLNPKLQKMLEQQAKKPPLTKLRAENARKAFNESFEGLRNIVIPGISIEDRLVQTQNRSTPIRIYTPVGTGTFPALIFIHGGGWVLGKLEHYDQICEKISKKANCKVISIDYGLAPEHKFPEPVEECYYVSRWIYEHSGELNIDKSKLAVGGDSAGGNLTAAISLLARDRKEFNFIYQVLIYPPTDINLETKSKIQNSEGYVLNREEMEWFRDCYLRTVEDAKNPLASPMLAESLKDLPPAYIITAEYDPLRDEGELYAELLIKSGIEVDLKRFNSVVHGFINMGGILKEADEAIQDVSEHLKMVFSK